MMTLEIIENNHGNDMVRRSLVSYREKSSFTEEKKRTNEQNAERFSWIQNEHTFWPELGLAHSILCWI